ncbi:trigger factor [Sporomusa sphaeroides]|uniref:Trigger factor n=2 Tax=Sporomusa TaxID=2375 RepID=A0ABP2CBD0_9FIRM|nr:trigger factor [Sporomusa sphaeroides]OLS57797.1 trigger factor [Sporomusa sphaeroides DSM 2875]CVK20988.1 Trigger factor [Sporomusa sphaeroides DSM 2875]SCM80828.1 Trigger factor [uncultured Sporomusa sp.]
MKVTAERIDNHKTVLNLEVPQAEVAKALEKAYRKLANQVNIPGFRKGKAPRKVIEMRIGKEALLDEAFEILAPEAYGKALAEQEIDPVGRPEIEVVTLAEDQPLVFKATVVKKPEVTLGQYKELAIEKTVAEVTEADIDSEIERNRSRNAKMVVVEDAELKQGDLAIIDFKGFIDGVPFEGGEGKSYPLEIGSGSFIPGFEDQLVGAKSGEEREVKVSFPEDYFVAELAGKEAAFTVNIHDIKRKELPELDDEFAKETSEFDTLAELKADIKNRLEQAAEAKAEREFRTAAIKTAVDNASLDVPEVMIENQIDTMIQDFDINLQQRGMKLDKYLEYTKMDMAALRNNYRDSALYNVKTDLVLEAIVKAEGLTANPEEMQQEIASMAANYQTTAEEIVKVIRQTGRFQALQDSVLRKKAAQLVIDGVAK